MRQRIARLGIKVLSFSKKVSNSIGVIWYFIHPYNASLQQVNNALKPDYAPLPKKLSPVSVLLPRTATNKISLHFSGLFYAASCELSSLYCMQSHPTLIFTPISYFFPLL
jgi:hypothetical protein